MAKEGGGSDAPSFPRFDTAALKRLTQLID